LHVVLFSHGNVSLSYNITRNEEFVQPLQLRDIKKKSLDRHLNILKHAFINFIFAKLELLCI